MDSKSTRHRVSVLSRSNTSSDTSGSTNKSRGNTARDTDLLKRNSDLCLRDKVDKNEDVADSSSSSRNDQSPSSASPPVRITFARYPKRERRHPTRNALPGPVTVPSRAKSQRLTSTKLTNAKLRKAVALANARNSASVEGNDSEDDQVIRVRRVRLPGSRKSMRISIKTQRMYGKDNSDDQDSKELRDTSSNSDTESNDSAGKSKASDLNAVSSETSEEEITSARNYIARKHIGKSRRRAGRAPARAKKRLPVRPPSPPRDLTEQQRQDRLDELVRQSAEISKELHAAISRTHVLSSQNRQAADSTEPRHTETGVKKDNENLDANPHSDLNLPIAEGYALQPHQIEGVSWLLNLDESGHNGILADEMGLGKTVQCLAFLASIVTRSKRGPHLIIAPLAVVSHWANEAENWFPGTMKIYTHMGNGESRLERLFDALADDDFDVIVTSYELALRDLFSPLGKISWLASNANHRRALRQFRDLEFEYLVVDEAHRLKNPNSKLTKALRQYKGASRRLLLTGTPLSNHLVELWALLNVLNPQIFGNMDTFKGWFQSPFDDGASLTNSEKSIIVARMHTVLRPFFRRRLRSDICPEFTSSDEVLIRCPATPLQVALQTYFRRCRNNSGVQALNNIVMKLRKTANCAWTVSNALFEMNDLENLDALGSSSGKLIFVHYALPRLLAAGHRVLIFSQFKGVLDILEDLLSLLDISCGRIDGGTDGAERGHVISQFNKPDSPLPVFLLSTRAGGVGINLQTADTVILFDSDWNPSCDLQAVSRIQRIGQKRTVHIMRLVTERQIDELIITRARKKLRTEAVAVGAGKFTTASEGEVALRQKDICELLDTFDAEQPLFHAEHAASELEENQSSKGDVSIANSSAYLPTDASGSISAVLPGTLEVDGCNTPVYRHNACESMRGSDASTEILPGMDFDKPEPVSKSLLTYIEEWNKNLLRSGESELPELKEYPPMKFPTAMSVPEWLRPAANPAFIVSGLKATSPDGAISAVARAREDAAALAGEGIHSRARRKARFDLSLQDQGKDSFDFLSSDDVSFDESAEEKPRKMRSSERTLRDRRSRQSRRSDYSSSSSDYDVDLSNMSGESDDSSMSEAESESKCNLAEPRNIRQRAGKANPGRAQGNQGGLARRDIATSGETATQNGCASAQSLQLERNAPVSTDEIRDMSNHSLVTEAVGRQMQAVSGIERTAQHDLMKPHATSGMLSSHHNPSVTSRDMPLDLSNRMPAFGVDGNIPDAAGNGSYSARSFPGVAMAVSPLVSAPVNTSASQNCIPQAAQENFRQVKAQNSSNITSVNEAASLRLDRGSSCLETGPGMKANKRANSLVPVQEGTVPDSISLPAAIPPNFQPNDASQPTMQSLGYCDPAKCIANKAFDGAAVNYSSQLVPVEGMGRSIAQEQVQHQATRRSVMSAKSHDNILAPDTSEKWRTCIGLVADAIHEEDAFRQRLAHLPGSVASEFSELSTQSRIAGTGEDCSEQDIDAYMPAEIAAPCSYLAHACRWIVDGS